MKKTKLTEDVPIWMRWVIILLYIIGTAVIFSSCSIVKKIDRFKEKQSQDTKIDSSGVVNKDVTKESKITTTTTEEAKGELISKGFEHEAISADVRNQPIVISDNGFTAIVTDSAGTTKLKVKLKDKKLPFNVNKKTVTTSDIKEEDKTKTKIDIQKDEEKETEKQTTDKDVAKSFVLPWWLWLILILLGLFFLWWKFIRK